MRMKLRVLKKSDCLITVLDNTMAQASDPNKTAFKTKSKSSYRAPINKRIIYNVFTIVTVNLTGSSALITQQQH